MPEILTWEEVGGCCVLGTIVGFLTSIGGGVIVGLILVAGCALTRVP